MNRYFNIPAHKRYFKPSVENFGATKILVISDPDNSFKRKEFKKAWGIFDDFDFEFVDADMGKWEFGEKFKEGEISQKFWDPSGCLSKNIIATAISHRKAWKRVLEFDNTKDTDFFLIMEDDARPTNYFLKDAFISGEFSKILDFIKRETVDLFWWGRATDKNIGVHYNELVLQPDPFLGLGAHAYMIKPPVANMLLNYSKEIFTAADCFIDYVFNTSFDRHYTPNWSFIRQEQHMLGQQFFPPNHKDVAWTSTTQPWTDYETRPFTGLKFNCTEEMNEYIEDVENITIENDWKVIQYTFKDVEDMPLKTII